MAISYVLFCSLKFEMSYVNIPGHVEMHMTTLFFKIRGKVGGPHMALTYQLMKSGSSKFNNHFDFGGPFYRLDLALVFLEFSYWFTADSCATKIGKVNLLSE